MARSLMYLFLAGSVLTVSSVFLPIAVAESKMLGTATVCFVLAFVLLVAFDRLPPWTFQVFLASATVLIEWAIYASGESTSPYSMFYFWIAIYAFYFFPRGQAILQMGFIVCAQAALFIVDPPSSIQVVHWAITMSGLLVAGALIGVLKEQMDKLIARLANAARTDALTGLLNRRGAHDLFEVELERARRNGRPVSVIVCDLDGFKAVNDRFGHHAGDRALERASAVLQSAKRRIDTAARIGGEEFAIVVPDTDDTSTYVLAERVRREMRDAFADQPVKLTVSLGVATFPKHGATTEALMRAADQALYAAKEFGRDRAVIFNPEIAQTLFPADGRRGARRERHTATVLALAEVLDIRDAGTALHSQTVCRYAEAIARELRLPSDLVERVRFAGIVHDVGKIGVSDSVLRKPGRLTEEDWAEMRRHPEIGARILDGANLEDISGWVLAHHERPDGLGYPYGLAETDIPLEARILAVADAYEAMTTDRVYRSSLPIEEARAQLREGIGTQFDQRVVEAFLAVLERESAAAEQPSSLKP